MFHAGMGELAKTELALQPLPLSTEHYPAGVCWFFGLRGFGRGDSGAALPVLVGWNPPLNWNCRNQVTYCWRNWCEGDVLVANG